MCIFRQTARRSQDSYTYSGVRGCLCGSGFRKQDCFGLRLRKSCQTCGNIGCRRAGFNAVLGLYIDSIPADLDIKRFTVKSFFRDRSVRAADRNKLGRPALLISAVETKSEELAEEYLSPEKLGGILKQQGISLTDEQLAGILKRFLS